MKLLKFTRLRMANVEPSFLRAIWARRWFSSHVGKYYITSRIGDKISAMLVIRRISRKQT